MKLRVVLCVAGALATLLSSQAVAPSAEAWAKDSSRPTKICASIQNKSSKPSYQATIVINAPAKSVWQAIQEQRVKDPDQRETTLLKKESGRTLIEQKLCFASPFGDAECTVNASEIPLKRVDYWMVESEDFKSIEGSWVLNTMPDGQSTQVTLSSSMDLRIPLPKFVVNMLIQKRVERNLDMVKKIAEKLI